MASVDMSRKSEQAEDDPNIEISQKLWENDLVWYEITNYLTITDLKEFSRVSHYFLGKVRSLTRFGSLAGQVVTGEMNIHTFKLSRAIVQVNKIDEKVLVDLAPTIFQDTEYLELHLLGMLSDEARNSRLVHIVANCPKLKSLALGTKYFLGKDYTSFFKDTKVKLILSDIKELGIGAPSRAFNEAASSGRDLYSYDELWDEDWSVMCDTRIYTYRHNFTNPIEIFELFPDLQLKLGKFSFIEQRQIGGTSSFHPDLILTSSQYTLTKLTLSIGIDTLDRLNAMKFPNLSQLMLAVFASFQFNMGSEEKELIFTAFTSVLISFLRNHISSLAEFVFHSSCKFSLVPFCEVLKSSKKIKTLIIKGKRSFTQNLQGMNWDFLGGLSTLRDFKIILYDTEDDSEDEWISSDEEDEWISSDEEDEVPNNVENELPNVVEDERLTHPTKCWDRYFTLLPSTVESIGFWNFYYSGRLEDLTSIVTTQLTRFENLTALRMPLCPTFFNDDILQFICKKLNKLRIMQGNFANVTDFGISGCRDDGYNSGISLKNLTGMTKLDIYCYSDNRQLQITWEGLLCSIQFLDLVNLSISAHGIKDMHNDSLLQPGSKDVDNYIKLIGQNPSLERISLPFCEQLGPEQRDKVLKANPRIKFEPHVNLNQWP